MNNIIDNTRTVENDVIVTAKPSDFRVGTHNRIERLIDAVKPITDKWYIPFRTAMKKGADDIIRTWMDYKDTVIATKGRQPDEIFRYATITLILNGIKAEAIADETLPVQNVVIEVINLILGVVKGRVRWEYPLKQFLFENDVFYLARETDTLGIEYVKGERNTQFADRK